MVQGSDGSRGEVLSCRGRSAANPFLDKRKALQEQSYVSMNGQEVYKFAVKTVPEAIQEAVRKAGLSVEEIDLFLLHQANYRIIESVAKRLGQPMEKFPTNLQECGNISAASVPILLVMSAIMVDYNRNENCAGWLRRRAYLGSNRDRMVRDLFCGKQSEHTNLFFQEV